MPKIRITGFLPKADKGLQTPSGNDEDEWIRRVLLFERYHGDPNYGPLQDFGFHCPYGYTMKNGECVNKITGIPLSQDPKYKNWSAPTDINQAVTSFKEQYLPQVQQYPAEIRERMGDYIYNTGRNPNDLILLASGLATLDEVNSEDPKVAADLQSRYAQNKSKIEVVMSKPDFTRSIDNAKDQLYRTTGSYPDPKDPTKRIKYTTGNPNPTYNQAWSKRLGDLYDYKPPVVEGDYPRFNLDKGTLEPTDYEKFRGVTADWRNKRQITSKDNTPDGLVYGSDGKPIGETIGGTFKPFEDPYKDKKLSEDIKNSRRSKYTFNRIKQNVYDPKANKIYDEYGKEIGHKDDDGTPHMYSQFRQKAQKIDNWAGDQIIKGAEWMTNNPTARKITGTADKITKGMLAVSPIVDFITDRKKQKRWDRWFTEGAVSDNLYAARPASMTGNRGDWEINTGIFRPDEIGFKSKGMYTNKFDYPAPGVGVSGTIAKDGGSVNTNNMQKIRIKITGGNLEKMATGGQPMTYSGQLGYGLNLGQKRIYTDMPPDITENINKKLQPVPRAVANLEAEEGETVFGDLDGDGAMEHMEIGGKKHSQGGTPLSLPEGSFIFSDAADLRIKDKKILERFNMSASKKGYTPAEIAKKYEMNKYKALMEDPNADPLRKSTAQIMIKTFQKKLAELALIQEEMKGFPQGIPEVAKKALPQLQTIEDQQKQPGASDQLQFGQPGQQEQAPEMSEEQMMMMQQQQMMQQPQMQMEFGGMIPEFDLAGTVGDPPGDPLPDGVYGNIDINAIRTAVDAMNKQQQAAQVQNQQTNTGVGPGDEQVDQTYTPKTRADLNDPEYAKFQALLKKYDTGKYGKKGIYVNSMTLEDANEFARLATKFGFNRTDEKGNQIYRIIQGATTGYSFNEYDPKNKKTKSFGFFGGYKPEMYERKVIEDRYGKEASDKMSDVQRRRAFLKEIGIDDTKYSDQQLTNSKKFYTGDKKFFKEVFYPAFTKTFQSGDYRPEMQDDMLVGAEHYDSYRSTPKIKDDTVVGYKCTGRDSQTRKPNIISSSYMNMAALRADGAALSSAEAEAQCPLNPNDFTGGKTSQVPFDFMTPDKVTMLAALLGAPKKYLPWGQKLPFEPGDVAYEDWRGKAAARQSLFNKMSSQLNTYSPGTSAAANLSFLAGQQAEGLAQDIAQVDARNVATANQFSTQERQRKDQNNLFNLAVAQDLYKGNVTANQQYDNAKRAYFNNMAKAYGNAWKNRMYLGLLNSVNPMFNIDPWRGESWFKGGYDEGDLGGGLFNTTASTSSGLTYRERVAQKVKEGYTIDDARKAADADIRQANKGTTTALTPAQQQYNMMRGLLSGYGALGSMGGFSADESA